MGRPKIGGRVAVNLGDKLIEAVDTWATQVGLSRSEAIRSLLVAALWIDSEVRTDAIDDFLDCQIADERVNDETIPWELIKHVQTSD